MVPASGDERIREQRDTLPDTGRPGFAEECRRQSELVAAADAIDQGLWQFLDVALADLDNQQDQ